jgi:LacI family transcriptional regulator
MHRQNVESLYVKIPPIHIVPRRSTQTLAVESPEVERLIQDIQKNISKPFGVEFLVERSHASRRSLETRFQQVLGCSPYAFITRLRVDHAKELLRSADAPNLTRVARASGFTDLRHFRITFKRITGQSPSAFRKACL